MLSENQNLLRHRKADTSTIKAQANQELCGKTGVEVEGTNSNQADQGSSRLTRSPDRKAAADTGDASVIPLQKQRSTKMCRKPDFGDWVTIEQKRYGVPNEHFRYKVIGRLVSNVWQTVPVDLKNSDRETHDESTEIIQAICDLPAWEKVERFRVEDVCLIECRNR